MRNRKKLAGIALGVIVISGILGIFGLAALGFEVAAGPAAATAAAFIHVNLFAVFAALIVLMAVAAVIMVLAIPKRR